MCIRDRGKTNLLAAVAHLSGVSHRARYDKELIQFGVDHAFLKGSVFSRERTFLLEAELHRGARRVLRSNGVKLKNSGAVSYTHLDVYKRQTLGCSGASSSSSP